MVPTLVHSGLQNSSIFGRKLQIQTAHHTFPENRHPEVTERLYYVLFTCQSEIPTFLGSSSWIIIAQIIMMLVLINMVLNVEHH